MCIYIYIYIEREMCTCLHIYSCYGGSSFVCVMKYHSDVVFAKRYDFGCNLCFAPTPNKQLHTKLYRLAFLCLPWSQTK